MFSIKQLKNLYDTIDILISERNSCNLFNLIWQSNSIPNKFSGYKIRDFKKFAHTVIFFIKEPFTFVTRLNKCLFYSDFLNFKNTGYSITGLRYAAIPRGPVPNDYDYLYQLLFSEKFIDKEDVPINNDEIYERFKPAKEFDESLFTKEELSSLNCVMDKFRFLKTEDIIKISHKEDAWIENVENRDLISYQDYGFKLKGI